MSDKEEKYLQNVNEIVDSDKKTISKVSEVTSKKRSLENTEDSALLEEHKPKEKKQHIEKSEKEGEEVENKKEGEKEKEETKPKFVFGGSSSFSKGFKFTKPLIPEKDEKTSLDEDKKEPVKPIKAFGSSTAFGQGFGLLKEIAKKETNETENKKNDPDNNNNSTEKDENSKENEKNEIEKNDNKSSTPALFKLEEVHNGEEDETTIFNANTKLYALTDLKEGWKERGLGPIHLNYHKETKTHRLIIRQRLTLQLLLNLKLVKGLKVFKGFPGSSYPEKFVRIVITVDKQVVQYTMKFSTEELAEDIFKLLEKLV
ncbi:PH domain-like protein [Hanseniaspora valbyensis NRRL Y-1626]|uniref:PH domain-like protein n=1 Tax=Hanseniaspora valbyensis NRRL Y-1626 TaxID=766949 RepID=A0A1B7T8A6_9ASCO|nr:PH domain-like protein [Hanseniaspora valbyensis NRRL Y-1626]